MLADHIRRLHQQVAAQVRVADLTPAEADRDLDAMPVVEELARPAHLRAQVVRVDLDGEPDLLEGLALLLLLRVAVALLKLVLVLPVVEDSAYRRDRSRGDLNEVQTLLPGQLLCPDRGHHSELLTVFVDDPHLANANHLIDAEFPCDSRVLSTNGPPTDTAGWPAERGCENAEGVYRETERLVNGRPARSEHVGRANSALR